MTTFRTCESEKLFSIQCAEKKITQNTHTHTHTTVYNTYKNGEQKFSTKWQRKKKPIKVEALEKRWNFC